MKTARLLLLLGQLVSTLCLPEPDHSHHPLVPLSLLSAHPSYSAIDPYAHPVFPSAAMGPSMAVLPTGIPGLWGQTTVLPTGDLGIRWKMTSHVHSSILWTTAMDGQTRQR